jgi:hypothetical protein
LKTSIIKTFNKFITESGSFDDDADVMARHQLFGANAFVAFEFGKVLVIGDDEISELVSKYNETHTKNKEWFGGPTNNEFSNYFINKYDVKGIDTSWKPMIMLIIETPDYGIYPIGFGLISKKISSTFFSTITIDKSKTHKNFPNVIKNYNKDSFEDGDERVKSEFYKYTRTYLDKLTYNEVLDVLNLDITFDWNWKN